jgi:hypothetical protein
VVRQTAGRVQQWPELYLPPDINEKPIGTGLFVLKRKVLPLAALAADIPEVEIPP